MKIKILFGGIVLILLLVICVTWVTAKSNAEVSYQGAQITPGSKTLGFYGTYTNIGPGVTIPPGTIQLPVAECDQGDVATGGGFWATDIVHISQNRPQFDSNDVPFAWIVEGHNAGSTPLELYTYVVCAKTSK